MATKIIGKCGGGSCLCSASFKKATLILDRGPDAYDEHGTRFIPIGSTGRLRFQVGDNPSTSDVILDLDMANASPAVIGKDCDEVFYWTVDFPLLQNGVYAGTVKMIYKSGTTSNGRIDLDIAYLSQTWYGTCISAYHYPAYGINTDCNLTETTANQ